MNNTIPSLNDNEYAVLMSLSRHCQHHDCPARPMDVGGSDGSHHSATLRKLAARGFVERMRRNSICNMLNSRRGSYCYRISAAGIAAASAEAARRKTAKAPGVVDPARQGRA